MATMRGREKEAGSTRASDFFFDTLAHYRELVLDRMTELVPQTGRYARTLYGPMLDYPLREGKGFRPALCLAMCQACGGSLEDALETAAALEMFHNAFLIHDDIEDASESRRGEPTLHHRYGVGIATNVGDALNMLALRTLLRNTRVLGLERALTVIQDVSRMAQESTEGQSIELDWIARPHASLGLRDYLRMTYKKTCWYTCIAPMRVGALIADVPPARLGVFLPFGFRIGAAFQIQDDVLNLHGEEALYGKEIAGDIAEGKRTLMIIHAFRAAGEAERERLAAIYAKPREAKGPADLEFVMAAFERLGSIEFAKEVAMRLTLSAKRLWEREFRWLAPTPHRRFVEEMIGYMIERRL